VPQSDLMCPIILFMTYGLLQVNPNIAQLLGSRTDITVELIAAFEVEMDEPWSYVAHKGHQRGLWYALII
jgi:hypothetical protein